MSAPQMRTPGGNLASANENTDTAIVALDADAGNEKLAANLMAGVRSASGRHMLNEQNIPAELLPQASAWFARQLAQLEKAHGPHWPAHRDWLVSYLNEELRERVANREVRHGL
jgi:hypothetical protein